jgi:hypothetical protein
MANRIKYAVSMTPIETLTDAQSITHDVIAGEVGKSLGGDGTALVTDFAGSAAANGYLNQTVNYISAVDDADTMDISSEAGASLVFIKNTGCLFSSATVLGAASALSLKVMYLTNTIAILDAGEAIILKDDNSGIVCTNIHIRTVTAAGANQTPDELAVEFYVQDVG